MKFWVATRKGLIEFEKKSKGWEWEEEPSFVGDLVTAIFIRDDGKQQWAALNLGHFGVKLRRSEDAGKSWEELESPTYPQVETNGAGQGADSEAEGDSLQQIWIMESAGPEQPDQLWAGTIPGGLFKSEDRGKTWELNRSLWDRPERKQWFGGGYDDPGIHSVCVDPRNSDTVRVGVSCGGVWRTDDAGKTWRVTTTGMFADYMPPEQRELPEIQDPHRMVQCPASPDVLWAQHHNGVFRSTDGAESWTSIDVKPSAFGFAVAVHPQEPMTAWLVPGVKDECRVPVDQKFVVARTRDGGESFEILEKGLPTGPSYDLVFRHAFEISPCGQVLVMGSTTGNLWISENGGDQWECVTHHLPPVYAIRFSQ